ncbi:DUF5723 family protein [Mucilaginibacter sp. UR6-11]|uniref:DUF5723 family protein n=1 Tax=Mucilaginibacter sp. UR6-11 TaxID=1435644 RepID=UPI001E383114|nr:DUF5723 family protein [Mucilaginibacter sp. UR6-11]MCC8423431.1 DUF5723 family protein [Mucilaginibacter sp. UR6-11]
MKKTLFVWCFILITVKVFGQQFSQYNTGSLYESFENPAQRAFIPDTTKQFAFNFFIPNFNANLYFTGNGQEALKTRAFSAYYNTANLVTGQNAYNRVNVNANAYTIMFKVFGSENGDQEVGFSLNTKAEARGFGTDESIALFNGFTNFPANSYTNIFNDNIFYQAYHQIGFTYREQVTKKFAFGVKLSALSGLTYRKTSIDQSSISFNKATDEATLTLQGTNMSNSTAGQTHKQQILPSFRNPGASISIGTSYIDESGYKWQGNIKDLGFIHWSSQSETTSFSGSEHIAGFSSTTRENTITHGLDSLTSGGQVKKAFNSYTNGRAELSVSKSYWMDDEENFKFTPTLIASKELFYNGFTMALVAPVKIGKHTVSLTPSYNELKLLNLGLQYMFKSANSEFFIGSERLMATGNLIGDAAKGSSKSQTQTEITQGSFSGMDFYMGISFKFGQTIERRLNSSTIPTGDKGFIGKIWENLFHKDKNY